MIGSGRRASSRADSGRVPRQDRRGISPVTVGLLAVVLVAIGTYFGFRKDVPFTHGFRVEAVFQSANNIRPNSPVRIAGVNVGKVKSVSRQPGTNAAVVSMEIQDKGLPIHKDATMKIRPRIFLEGNFFVDLRPGTPSSPVLGDQDTIPMAQTSTPVQLDQVLTSLQGDTRKDLQAALQGLGTGLTFKPSVAEDADADPSARGQSAAESLNDAARSGAAALRGTAIVNQALLGQRADDLGRLISSLGKVTGALDANESSLQDLVSNFNTTMAATADRSADLRRSIRLLGPTLTTTDRALGDLDAALPNTRAFARGILPGVRQSAATIDVAFPWVEQARALLSPAELGGQVNDLQPAIRDLSSAVTSTRALLPQADLAAQCATKVLLPTGDVKIADGAMTTGVENYKEFWYAMVGLAGESQNFDANGQYVRFATGGGDQVVASGKIGGAAGAPVFGRAASQPLGTRPAYTGRRPPYNATVPCKNQKVPDLNAARTGPADGSPAALGGRTAVAATASAAAAKASGAARPAGPDRSLTAQLFDRLNPFRGAFGGTSP